MLELVGRRRGRERRRAGRPTATWRGGGRLIRRDQNRRLLRRTGPWPGAAGGCGRGDRLTIHIEELDHALVLQLLQLLVDDLLLHLLRELRCHLLIGGFGSAA